MWRCNTGSKINNDHTLCVNCVTSKIYTKNFMLWKLLPLLCYMLCEKKSQKSAIWPRSYKWNSKGVWEHTAENNMPLELQMRRVALFLIICSIVSTVSSTEYNKCRRDLCYGGLSYGKCVAWTGSLQAALYTSRLSFRFPNSHWGRAGRLPDAMTLQPVF